MDGLGGLIALAAVVVLFVLIALVLHLSRDESLDSLGAAIATPFLALLALIVHGGKGRPA